MDKEIVLYTTPGCPDCAALKAWLGQQGIAFSERDLSQPGVADEAKSRYGVRIAPITVIGDTFFYGTFSEQEPRIREALAQR
ncbi:MAG: glutaredoxin family protein [Gammaproteobacteria bacterium]|jgi:glutaredoxin